MDPHEYRLRAEYHEIEQNRTRSAREASERQSYEDSRARVACIGGCCKASAGGAVACVGILAEPICCNTAPLPGCAGAILGGAGIFELKTATFACMTCIPCLMTTCGSVLCAVWWAKLCYNNCKDKEATPSAATATEDTPIISAQPAGSVPQNFY